MSLRQVVRDETPFPQIKGDLFDFYDVWKGNAGKLIEQLPKDNTGMLLSSTAFDILTRCWRRNPEERPKMSEARKRYQETSLA